MKAFIPFIIIAILVCLIVFVGMQRGQEAGTPETDVQCLVGEIHMVEDM
ncbi:MAG: hypothetical protein HFJ55_05615 [Clostridia bacterium]|jgi:hypothetical protein|nr:hypothetical protein [Clostridia bacterium]